MSVSKIEKAKERTAKASREKILALYETTCPQCRAKAIANRIEWAYIVRWLACHEPINLGLIEKVGAGKFEYLNRNCLATLRAEDCKRVGQTMAHLKCQHKACKSRGEKSPDKKDILLNKQIENLFDREKAEGLLKYPDDPLPDDNLVRENALCEKGFGLFFDLYTKRNLMALTKLYEAIWSLPKDVQEPMLFVFTSMLYECTCRLCHIKDGAVVKPGHDWWPPALFASNNVWKHYETRYATICRGLQEVQNHIGSFYQPAALLAFAV